MVKYFSRRLTAPSVAAIALLSLLCLTGCGSRLPTVEGTVTLDGTPVPDARVVFESPERPTATAKTNASGHYDVRTASQRGMAIGSYKVSVSAYQTKDGGTESPIPVLSTPKKYNSVETSGLSASIEAGHNTVDFTLESQKK